MTTAILEDSLLTDPRGSVDYAGSESRFDGWRSMSAILTSDLERLTMGYSQRSVNCGASPVTPCGC